jgi:hypothetical protein
MKKLKTKIEIEVSDIKVGEKYFSFRYLIARDGKLKKKKYESDYSCRTAEEFKKVLEDGYALQLALEEGIS